MHISSTSNSVEVVIGDRVASLYWPNSSEAVVANILGTVRADGIERIYLDRLVHTPGQTALGAYSVSGAISSILTRPTEE